MNDQNLKGLSLQTSFSQSTGTGHNNECVAAHNSFFSDPTMTVDSVTQILNKIPGYKWEMMMGKGGLGIPGPLLEEIQMRYSTDVEKIHAYADYYVNCHPDAEWEHLTAILYERNELALARESKSFMSTSKPIQDSY